MRQNSTIGIILIAAGALLAMKFLGLGHLINWAVSLIFPLILIGSGYMVLRNGNRTIGTIIGFVGVIFLLFKLHGLIMLFLAVGLVVWGVSMFRNRRYH